MNTHDWGVIKKLYKSAVKCYDQKQYKYIIEIAMISTP